LFDLFGKLFDGVARLRGMVQEAMPLNVQMPVDVAGCHCLIHELMTTVQQRDRQLAAADHRLEQLLRRLYGPRSERYDPSQPNLFDQCPPPPEPPPPMEPDEPEAPARRKKKKGHGRRPLAKDLRRQPQEHDLTEAEKLCPCCHKPRLRIGEQTSEQLAYVPASMYVIVHVRPTYACQECLRNGEMTEPSVESRQAESTLESWLPAVPAANAELLSQAKGPLIITAPMPKQPIPKGLADAGLLAHIITSKFVDHLPLYRLESIFGRQGVDISRKTMSDWLRACAKLFMPLYELLTRRVLQSRVIHNDDTPLPVQAKKTGKTKTGRLWDSVGDAANPYTVFHFTPNRSGDWPAEFFKGYKGYLQVDAYTGYESLFASGDIIEVACWAHVRRKFFEAKTTDELRSHLMLAMIRGLYKVEDEVAKLDDEAAKVCYRQQHAKPLLDKTEQWLRENQDQVLPKSPLGEAIGYARNNWTALQRYVDVGYLSIDNNVAERALRAVAIGRKNYLFAGSDAGGRTAAIMYSLVNTCKRHGIDPWTYLRDALARLPELPPEQLDQLLPDVWAKTQRQQIEASPT
jgi:transposase